MIDVPKILAPLDCLGVAFNRDTDVELAGDCPFCEADNHFYANKETGQWSCKKCGEEGNVINFLKKWSGKVAQETTRTELKELAKLRGLPVEAVVPWNFGFDGEQWLLPVLSQKGTCRDVRRWNPEGKHGIVSTTGCELQLFGLYEWLGLPLFSGKEKPRPGRVWLCEGEWDAIALRWFLMKAGIDEPVLGVPGAGVFKKEWVEYFKGWDVWIMFDADDAGDKGSHRAAKMLHPVARTIMFVNWPETVASGFDVRDFVKYGYELNDDFRKHVAHLIKLCKKTHRRDDMKLPEKQAKPGETPEREAPNHIPSFAEVLKVFRRWCLMDKEFEMALRFVIATALSEQLLGDPVWVYLVGPPGSGKTIIVSSLQHSPTVIFRSNLNPKELVSGFNAGDDPSLLLQLFNKVLVVKDSTELVVSPQFQRNEVMGTLRGAYDGTVVRGFGNKVLRDYKVHFTLIMAVTPVINSMPMAELGERFLKFQMMRHGTPRQDDLIMAAVCNVNKDLKMGEELSSVVSDFMFTQLAPPDPPMWVKQRVVKLAQLVAMLRASVERDKFDRENLSHRVQHEVGTRIAKGLIKLAMALPYTFDRSVIDWEAYQVIERVAVDSMHPFHYEIAAFLSQKNGTAEIRDLQVSVGVPSTTLRRRLQDMESLCLVEKVKQIKLKGRLGSPPDQYKLTEKVQNLWNECKIGQAPVLKARVRV